MCPHFEPDNMFKVKEKVLKGKPYLSAAQLTAFFFPFSSDLLSLKSHRSAPLPRTIITLVHDPHWVAGREMNSQVGLLGPEYYFVRTTSACSSPHSFTAPTDAGNFPRWNCAKAAHDRWLLYLKPLPPSHPKAIYFCQQPGISDVPAAKEQQ